MLRDRTEKVDLSWKESWDFSRCFNHGWLTKEDLSK